MMIDKWNGKAVARPICASRLAVRRMMDNGLGMCKPGHDERSSQRGGERALRARRIAEYYALRSTKKPPAC